MEALRTLDILAATGRTTPAMIPGETLRSLRRYAHLTQRELATRLGYSQSQVHAWEHGICLIPREVLPQLLAILRDEITTIDEWNGIFAQLHIPAPRTPNPSRS